MSLAKSIPELLAGSVTAGFGLSLGRDLYRGLKRYVGIVAVVIVPVVLLLSPLIGVFFAGLWFAISDETFGRAAVRKALATAFIVSSLVVGPFPLMLLATFLPNPMGTSFVFTSGGILYALEYWTTYPTLLLTDEIMPYGAPLIIGANLEWKWSLVLFSGSVGIAAGAVLGRRRRRMFDAAAHNETFLKEAGLTQSESGLLIDREGRSFRAHDRTNDSVVFMLVGGRNKRATLEFDQAGRFTRWSGLMSL